MNNGGDITNYYNQAYTTSDNVVIDEIYVGNVLTQNYALIGTNMYYNGSKAQVYYLNITNFKSGGYAIAYQNLSAYNTSNATIRFVSISLKNLGAAAEGNNIVMAYNNTGNISYNTLRANGLTTQNGKVFITGNGIGDKTNQFLPLN